MKLRLLLAGAAVLVVGGSTAAAAPAESVTLEVERFLEQQTGLFRLRFSGVISSGAANEYVAVMHQKCGYRFSTAIGGATTQAGGAWEARRSDTVRVRGPVRIRLVKERQRRYRVSVTAEANLSRRFVALQRLAGGRWRHVRRARLAPYGQAGYGGFFTATFTVRKRGLRLRILVPEKTAAPCHAPAVSETFAS